MKLSIITINYNNQKGLVKTIESVASQTYKDYEYIVIDGLSSDGSKEVIEKYSKTINFWSSETDTGIYNAMNKGLKNAKGDFVIFMNSGDQFYDENVLKKVELKINSNFDLFYGDAYFISEKKSYKVEYPDKLSFHFFTYNSLCHQSCFIKRKLFDEVFYYNENLNIISDWEFCIYSICIKNIKYKHINEVISYYDFEGISSQNETKDRIKYETKIVMEKYFSAFIDDYNTMSEIGVKRMKNILHINKFSFSCKALKGFINILLVFLPKQK